MLSAIIFVIILFLINPILGVLGIVWFIGLGIYAWKNADEISLKSKKTSQRGRGGFLLFSFSILGLIYKGVKDMARPRYGRNGSLSIERRKRRK